MYQHLSSYSRQGSGFPKGLVVESKLMTVAEKFNQKTTVSSCYESHNDFLNEIIDYYGWHYRSADSIMESIYPQYRVELVMLSDKGKSLGFIDWIDLPEKSQSQLEVIAYKYRRHMIDLSCEISELFDNITEQLVGNSDFKTYLLSLIYGNNKLRNARIN